MDEFYKLDATSQAELVRRREVKAEELVEAAIARIERLNPALNAVVTPMFEAGRRQARSVNLDAPFAGVPFLLKDLGADYAGVPTTRGSFFFRDYVPLEDSELVRRYKRAGLVILGKTNTPELGLLPVTEPRLFGPCRNPWDLGRTAGGSSGGAAAAVSAGLVAAAHGNDGGGSLRIPASCCGLFALKPSRGRTPGRGGISDFLGVQHLITRSVRDSAAVLDATAGTVAGAAFQAPPEPGGFLAQTAIEPGRLRIAFWPGTVTGLPLHPDCVAAVEDGARLCRDLGHEVVEAALPIDGEAFMRAFMTVWCTHLASGLELAAATLGRRPALGEIEESTRACYERGLRVNAVEYLGALETLHAISTAAETFLSDYDAWLTATLGSPALPLGALTALPADYEAISRRAFEFVPNTSLFNLTGGPAMTLPLYWNGERLPVGVHFGAGFGKERTLLRLAAQTEIARPWRDKWPPVLSENVRGRLA